MKNKVTHELSPYYDNGSVVLILGSMPSVKSKELGFYYMHPQNRFWKTLARVYNETTPINIQERKDFLTRHKIALWDVIESCVITGSSDSSIANVKPNNINKILKDSNVKQIFTTGKKAYNLYNKYCLSKTKKEAISLPSTSPANCPKGIEEILYNEYLKIKQVTNKN
ncbi:MAG: DNA-deoxyinosine glycosylase [Bacilli bacterium]|nr:DNA-deoxyinosine glycosylase [Bacilli bacterium]